MNRMTLIIFVAFCLSFSLWGQPRKYDVDGAHSRIAFAAPFMGLTDVEGVFTDYRGTVMVDPENPLTLSASLVIETASVFTGHNFRDKHLRSGDFFAVDRFPVIRFRSTGARNDDRGLTLCGDLTIRDVTRPVQIRFRQIHGEMSDMWDNTRVGYRGELRISREAFGMRIPDNWNRPLDLDRLTIGDTVRIELAIQGSIRNVARMQFGRTGDPNKENLAALMHDAYQTGGIAAAVATYHTAMADNPDGYALTEWGATILGYRLLQQDRPEDAEAIFTLALKHFPESANLHDSMGEAAYRLGRRNEAIEHYFRAIALDPANTSAMEMLRLLDTEASSP